LAEKPAKLCRKDVTIVIRGVIPNAVALSRSLGRIMRASKKVEMTLTVRTNLGKVSDGLGPWSGHKNVLVGFSHLESR
jgi:hypothetical protein